MEGSPPGLILDDIYRVLGNRDPATVRLVVEAVEPALGITRIRYALVEGGDEGEPIRDVTETPVSLVGGVDPDRLPAGVHPGAVFAVPPKGAVGSEVG